jgi:hypothetical protein
VRASREAYETSGIGPEDLDVIEPAMMSVTILTQ